ARAGEPVQEGRARPDPRVATPPARDDAGAGEDGAFVLVQDLRIRTRRRMIAGGGERKQQQSDAHRVGFCRIGGGAGKPATLTGCDPVDQRRNSTTSLVVASGFSSMIQ